MNKSDRYLSLGFSCYLVVTAFWWLVAWAKAWKYSASFNDASDIVFANFYWGMIWPLRLLYLVIYEIV